MESDELKICGFADGTTGFTPHPLHLTPHSSCHCFQHHQMPLVRQTGQLQPMHGLNPYLGGQAANFFVRPEALHRQPDAPVSQQMRRQTDEIGEFGKSPRGDRGKA